MYTTIRATKEYRVCYMSEEQKELYSWQVSELENSDDYRILYDGLDVVMPCVKTGLKRYNEEREGNECFHLCEIFETAHGFWAYWRDEETDTDFVTKLQNK